MTRPSEAPPSVTRLKDDQSGAIMTIGLFFAVFALGMLWYMMGLGDAVHYRERMQDAADSGALAGAILHARGMNTIVLINWLMAAVLAVLVALRLIVTLIIVAEVALIIASIFGGGAASLIPVLEQQRQNVNQLTEQIEPVVNNILFALHQVGEVIRLIVPIGSNLRVISIVASGFQPEVNDAIGGVAIPPRMTLPVEDDDFSVLCEKAAEIVGHLALLPLSPVLPDFAEDAVRGALSSLAGAASGWFCGEEGAAPPSHTMPDRDEGRPLLPIVRQCAEAGDAEASNHDEVLAICRQAEQEENASMPDGATGACRQGEPVCLPIREDNGNVLAFDPQSWCGTDGAGAILTEQDCELGTSTAYGRRLMEARIQCAPEAGVTKRGYFAAVQEVTYYETTAPNGQVTRTEPELGPETPYNYTDADDDSPQYRAVPCEAEPGDPWNTDSLEEPVCHGEIERTPAGPNSVRVHYWQVTQVYGCRQRVPGRTVQVDELDMGPDNLSTGGEFEGEGDVGSLNSDGDSRNKNPFRFQEGLLLGTSDLQIRSLVLGDHPNAVGASGNPEGAVALTRWNHRDGNGFAPFLGLARQWGRFSVAQAEYYYGGTEARSEWMWNMKWTARLRRFRLHRERQGGEAHSDGASVGGDPPTTDTLLGQFEIPGADQLEINQPTCGGIAACEDAAGFMEQFNDLFLH